MSDNEKGIPITMVWKYRLHPDKQEQVLNIPEAYTLLSVQVQDNTIAMWVLVTITDLKPRKFFVHDTGKPLLFDCNVQYVGTVQLDAGSYVKHIFAEQYPANDPQKFEKK